MVDKSFFFLPKDKGGWGLVHLLSKAKSLFFSNNLLRCVSEDFEHHRKSFFKYFFSVRCRDFFPTVFDNTTPHILVLKKSCPYYGLIELYRDIYDKLGVILPFAPSVNQVYQWLLELIDVPSQLRVKFSAGLSEEKQILVWRSVHSGALSARYRDFMWRLSSGSLKTGEVLAR